MDKGTTKETVQQYVETQQARIAKSRNARKWFYRGIVATLAAGYVIANVTKDDNTEEA